MDVLSYFRFLNIEMTIGKSISTPNDQMNADQVANSIPDLIYTVIINYSNN